MNASEIPNWHKMPIADRFIYLRSAFIQGDIKDASRRDLEDYLVVLANTERHNNLKQQEEIERFRAVVRQFLDIRISEELHDRSVLWSRVAIGISILALVLSGWQALEAHFARVDAAHSTSKAPVPAQAPKPPKQ
jgi:hypothetical protein